MSTRKKLIQAGISMLVLVDDWTRVLAGSNPAAGSAAPCRDSCGRMASALSSLRVGSPQPVRCAVRAGKPQGDPALLRPRASTPPDRAT